MCGIAGILSDDYPQAQLEVLLLQMQSSLQHRAPDDRGIYISTNCKAALAHTRLAILDLTAAGHQPMSSVDGRSWITCFSQETTYKGISLKPWYRRWSLAILQHCWERVSA
jgi:asparagine synthetase B (glutamine-hydrolysing)